jgi:hypothetical protein
MSYLKDLFKETTRACLEWGRQARSFTLPGVSFQRFGVFPNGNTSIGAIMPISRFPDFLKYQGLQNNKLQVLEGTPYFPWLTSASVGTEGETFATDLQRAKPNYDPSGWNEIEAGYAVENGPMGHYLPSDSTFYPSFVSEETTTFKPIGSPFVQYNCATIFPTSGITYVPMILTIGGRVVAGRVQGFFVRPDPAMKAFPVLVKCEWEEQQPPDAQLPKATVTLLGVKGCCCLC